MRTLLATALLAVTLCLSPLTPAAHADKRTLVDSYSASDLRYILQDSGLFDEVDPKSPTQILIRKNGHAVLLIIYPDNDLGIYFGAHGTIPLEAINEWNRTKRLSRAYLDKENDIALESDLLANGGLNEEKVVSFVKFFFQSVDQYIGFVKEHL